MSTGFQRALVVLLLINIGLTATVLVRQETDTGKQGQAAAVSLPEDEVVSLGERVVAAFNSGDAEALYSLYHEDAKAKLTESDVAGQITRLQGMFGRVERMSYLNNLRLGEKNGEEYYQAHFAAGISRSELKDAQVVLHLIRDGDGLFLYGMRINAAQP